MRVGKPANAKSAYNYFTSLMHEEFRAEHPGKTVDFIDFQKRCAAKWKSLSAIEKAPFDKIAALDKLRFQEGDYRLDPNKSGGGTQSFSITP